MLVPVHAAENRSDRPLVGYLMTWYQLPGLCNAVGRGLKRSWPILRR